MRQEMENARRTATAQLDEIRGRLKTAPGNKAAASATEDVMNKQAAPLTSAQIRQVAQSKGWAPALTKDDYDKLAPGTVYIGPSGIPRTK